MADDIQETRSGNALQKRAEQLKRWKESETNKEPPDLKNKNRKVNFSQGCVFLAACASGDKEEVKRLLANGADINTANVDGLTALHQSCIDDNLNMVEFLVESGADLDRGDNEGWTPLHATASCGFLDIAKFLIESGATVAAVNNDGDLPLDIAESDEMEELLQAEIDRQGINAEVARNEEEQRMLVDANQWLSNKIVKERKHEKTGATALHVAAAKGYHKVMNLLIQAGVDLDIQDKDGWTPLHASAHWGQKEACEILSENLCNLELKNYAGQTAFDVADPELIKFLEELKKKQEPLIKKDKPEISNLIPRKPPPLKRRSSVTRMSVVDKSNINSQDVSKERAHLQSAIRNDRKDDKEKKLTSSESEEGSSDSEVEKKNEANRAATLNSILSTSKSQSKPAQSTGDDGHHTAWRTGLRKTGSSSAVPDLNIKDSTIPDRIPRSASSPRIPSTDQKEEVSDSPASIDETEATDTLTSSTDELEEVNESNSEEEVDEEEVNECQASASTSIKEYSPVVEETKEEEGRRLARERRLHSSSALDDKDSDKSFVPPVRDDESETQRKLHAKRVRETRRSTQPFLTDLDPETISSLSLLGVRAEDLQNAEIQLLKKQQEEDERRERESEMHNDDQNDSEDTPHQRIPRRDSEDNKPSTSKRNY